MSDQVQSVPPQLMLLTIKREWINNVDISVYELVLGENDPDAVTVTFKTEEINLGGLRHADRVFVHIYEQKDPPLERLPHMDAIQVSTGTISGDDKDWTVAGVATFPTQSNDPLADANHCLAIWAVYEFPATTTAVTVYKAKYINFRCRRPL